MSYPVLEAADARVLRDELRTTLDAGGSVEELVDRAAVDLADRLKLQNGADFPVAEVEAVAAAQHDRWKVRLAELGRARSQDLWQLEAEMAGPVHACLRDVDVSALADPDLWRYLHLGPFRWYLLTREPEMQDQDFGGTDFERKYWLLVRTFLWGKHAHDPADSVDPYRRTTAVAEAYKTFHPEKRGGSIDFWHSHVIRVDFTRPGPVSRAFVDEATTVPPALDSKDQRTAHLFAKRMTRLARTVDLSLVPAEKVRALVHEQKMRTLGLI